MDSQSSSQEKWVPRQAVVRTGVVLSYPLVGFVSALSG
jgi:hypothetical protein